MKLPRFTLRDLLWLMLVVGLILTLFIRERQASQFRFHVRQFLNQFDEMYAGWQWSFETLAQEHTQQTGVKVHGIPEQVTIATPDGRIARKVQGQANWEWNTATTPTP